VVLKIVRRTREAKPFLSRCPSAMLGKR
jgi:hypothetical protein